MTVSASTCAEHRRRSAGRPGHARAGDIRRRVDAPDHEQRQAGSLQYILRNTPERKTSPAASAVRSKRDQVDMMIARMVHDRFANIRVDRNAGIHLKPEGAQPGRDSFEVRLSVLS